MRLPNAEEAWIHPDKILKYLLSDTHERGQSKAAFFKRFGFSVDNWDEFDLALRKHAIETEVARTEPTPEGCKYILEGPLECPDGRKPHIRAIWVIEWNQSAARLLSAYPLGEKSHDK
jgi:hypothetical protein